MADVQASFPSPETDPAPLSTATDATAASETLAKDAITLRRSTLSYLLLAGCLLIGAYLIGWFAGTSSGQSGVVMRTAVVEAAGTSVALGSAPTQPPLLLATASADRVAVPIDNSPTLGPDTAPVTLVEFGEYQCPFCKRFHDQVLPALLKQYDGKLRFVFRSYPVRAIHVYAESAAEAARCARDQQKFWEYQDLLFQDTQRLARTDLLAYAGQVRLDMKQFQDCLESGRHAPDVERDYQAGVTLGVSGTPTFFINGRLLTGAQPLAVFTAVIDAERSATPAPTAAS